MTLSCSKIASVWAIFFLPRLGHALPVVPQLVQPQAQRLAPGAVFMGVALLRDELATHLVDRQPGVQALGAKLRVTLALPIDNGTNIVQQPGQVRLYQPAAPQMKRIDAHQAAGEFAPSLADGPLGPPQLTHCRCLAAAPELLDGARHEHAPRCALQRRCRGGEKGFERFGQFHGLLRKNDSGLVKLLRV